MSNSLEDSVLSLDARLRDEGDGLDYPDPPLDVDRAANMFSADPSSERRSITFIASLNGSLNGPRDFVYYDNTLHTDMPALATNSLRLCTEPNDLPPGTDTLTYPGYHQQIASVSGLHASIIEDRSPLLAAAFEDSRSGRRLHLETLSSNTVMPFLRFLYTGSYALFGGWEDVPTSVLLHCKMYWLGDLYDLPELKSQAYVNVLRQFEFGCSSPEKPIDLCSAIDFAYKTLAGHDAISDAIVQYCVTQCLGHKLHEDPEFKGLAYNVRAFHQDLTKVCRDRGYEDESSAIIIRLPYKHFAPDIYASLENPPIAGFDDIIHHFHSSDRFDGDFGSKPRQKLRLDEGQASPTGRPQALNLSLHFARKAAIVSPVDASPPKPAVALPIRQLNTDARRPGFSSTEQEESARTDTISPFRQSDNDLAKLSTAPPNSGFLRRRVNATIPAISGPGEDPSPGTQQNDNMLTGGKSLDSPSSARCRARRPKTELKLEGIAGRDNETDSPQRRLSRGFLEARPVQYKYKEFPAWNPQNLDGTPNPADNPFETRTVSEASQLRAQTGPNERQSIVSDAAEHAKEIKRRKVDGQDGKDFEPSYSWRRSEFTRLQSRHTAEPSTSHSSWGQSDRRYRPVDLQLANVAGTSHFTPSNASPTLPPTVFGPPQSSTLSTMTSLGTKIAADNIPMPPQVAYDGRHLQPMPPGLQSHPVPGLSYMANKMNPTTDITAAAAVARRPGLSESGNHALQDYQMQLMLLEQQNKKRLLMARQEQESFTPPPAPPISAQVSQAPTGVFAEENVLEEFDFDAFLKTEEYQLPPFSDHDLQASAGSFKDVEGLEGFDFDAFLTQKHQSSSAGELQELQIPRREAERLEKGLLQQQHQTARLTQELYSRLQAEKASKNMPMVQPNIIPPVTTRKCDGLLLQSTEGTLGLTTKTPPDGPSNPAPSANSIRSPARATSDSEVDMCDSDSDSDMSWVDVPSAQPQSVDNAKSSDATAAVPTTQSNSARAGAKRRSTSSDSEWDFC